MTSNNVDFMHEKICQVPPFSDRIIYYQLTINPEFSTSKQSHRYVLNQNTIFTIMLDLKHG
jgi:hypothetical protein